MAKGPIVLGLMAMLAAPASPREKDSSSSAGLRALCSERPGLATAVCTVDRGHVQLELGFVDWTLDRNADERVDRIDMGEILLRYGLGTTIELQLGWTAFGHVRTLDRAGGSVAVDRGVGDVTIGLKQNLRHPAERANGFAMSVLPFLTLPTGRSGVGDGTWSAGFIAPMSYKFSDTVSFALSPEIDAAANESGGGRHLSFGAAVGVQVQVAESLRLSPEFQYVRDDDPGHPVNMANASLSFDVRLRKMTQVDMQAVAGLNGDTPDIRLLCGVTHKF